MLAHLREAVRDTLPSKLVHAYRVVRHTMLWPTEYEMVVARRFLSRDRIAMDVGANVGLFTSVLARHSKKVIAFEPNPACARHLAEVLPRNCEVIAKAVSDTVGTTTLRVPVSRGIAMDALSTIETANRFASETRVTDFVNYAVETVTLDQIMLVLSAPTDSLGFINIDAEGHEFAVLRGGEDWISIQRPVLLIELEYRHGAAVADVFAWLKARGYVPRAIIDGPHLAPVDPADLRALQGEDRLARRLAGDRRSGYVNNVFFLPEGSAQSDGA
jgi:FkbM family methyltransferase